MEHERSSWTNKNEPEQTAASSHSPCLSVAACRPCPVPVPKAACRGQPQSLLSHGMGVTKPKAQWTHLHLLSGQQSHALWNMKTKGKCQGVVCPWETASLAWEAMCTFRCGVFVFLYTVSVNLGCHPVLFSQKNVPPRRWSHDLATALRWRGGYGFSLSDFTQGSITLCEGDLSCWMQSLATVPMQRRHVLRTPFLFKETCFVIK